MEINSYRDLEVWQKGMDLVVLCYDIAKQFPSDELYGLTSQLRRAAVSVPANIAEGHARSHTKEFLYHLSIAYGSLMEIETHVQIAQRVGYVSEVTVDDLLQRTAEVGRMLNGLKRSLNKNLNL
jgi:four helix bundle protein